MDKIFNTKIKGQKFYASLNAGKVSICVTSEMDGGVVIVNFEYPGYKFESSLLWPQSKVEGGAVVAKEFNGDITPFEKAARELVGDVDYCG